MKFEEDHVLNKKKSVFTVDNPSSTELDPSSSNANKRPTFSDFVHKLRQQSTRTRFVNKKLANASDEEEMKDQDPSLDTNDNIKSIPDSQIEHLDISTNIKEKKPGKRVTIVVDESSEEEEEQSDIVTIGGKHVFIEDIQPDRFMQNNERGY
ncbi:hypothetical protein G6F61_000044 [Rhizopus arrhizus]|nr:hypothetical protein G6F42_002450 [Rhizopus arrhizus]KAG1384895.1 hypothetical protein G6F61_000044 [Rhizopus arrhizus]